MDRTGGDPRFVMMERLALRASVPDAMGVLAGWLRE